VKVITNRAAFILTAFTILTWTTACQTSPAPKSGSENPSVTNTTTQPTTNLNPPEVPKAETSAPSAGGSLATPTETYKTGYTARQKKDIASLKRVMSKEALEFLTEVGKAEQKTLDDQLKALAERPQASTAETRNERISGDRASLEYLNERGKWVSMEFVKEGNDWKIDLPKAQ
jgi:hypothetical protein